MVMDTFSLPGGAQVVLEKCKSVEGDSTWNVLGFNLIPYIPQSDLPIYQQHTSPKMVYFTLRFVYEDCINYIHMKAKIPAECDRCGDRLRRG